MGFQPFAFRKALLGSGLLFVVALLSCLGGDEKQPVTGGTNRGHFTVLVPAPGGGVDLDTTTFLIRWRNDDVTPPIPANVRIELYRGDSLLMVLVSGAPNNDSYLWNVANTRLATGYRFGSGSNYRLKFTNVADTSEWDFSGTFSVYSDLSGSLQITLPASTTNVLMGQSLNIEWLASIYNQGGGMTTQYIVQLYKDTAFVSTISASMLGLVTGTVLYPWPSVVTTRGSGNDYLIRVFSAMNPSIQDYSERFTIRSLYQGSLSLTSPAAGDTLRSGSPGSVTWDTTGNPGSTATIQLYRNDTLVYAVTSVATVGARSYLWSVPMLPVSNRYRIRIVSNQDAAFGDTSAYFTLGAFPPGIPVPFTPANGDTGQSTAPNLAWSASAGATSYRLQVATDTGFTTGLLDYTGLVAIFRAVTGLSQSTVYYWRVNASNVNGASAWSAVWSFTTGVNPPPSAPVLLSPANGATNALTSTTLSWSATGGATSYRVQVATNAGFTTGLVDTSGLTATSRSITGLDTGATYYWRVSATNANGTSPWSAAWSFTTMPTSGLFWDFEANNGGFTTSIVAWQWGTPTYASGPLGAHSGVRVWGTTLATVYQTNTTYYLTSPSFVVPAAGNVSFWEWYQTEACCDYGYVEISIDGGSLYTTLGTRGGSISSNSNGWIQTNYSLSAYAGQNAIIRWRFYSDVSSVWAGWFIDDVTIGLVPPPVLPPAPTLISPANGATGVTILPSLTWTAVTSATSYTMITSTSPTFSDTVDIDIVTGTSSLADFMLAGVTYYWHIKATNGAGDGPWSAAWSFTTAVSALPPAPTLLDPFNGSSGEDPADTWFDWSDLSGTATSFALQVSTSSSFTSTVVNQSNILNPFYNATTLAAGTTYYWRVSATNGSGTSSWSTVWNFTTATGSTAPPSIPVLISPANGSTGNPTSLFIMWDSAASTSDTYRVQIATDPSFVSIVRDTTILQEQFAFLGGLTAGTLYYWRASASNGFGTSAWSTVWSFTAAIGNPTPQVMITEPMNGTTNVSTGDPILIAFNTSMDSVSALAAVSFNPPLSNDTAIFYRGLANGVDAVVFMSMLGLSTNTRYTVTVATSARSQAGVSMAAPYTFSFTTGSTAPAAKASASGSGIAGSFIRGLRSRRE